MSKDTTKVRVGRMGKIRLRNSTIVTTKDGIVASIEREGVKTLKEKENNDDNR